MSHSYKFIRLTDCRWANLLEVHFERSARPEKSWIVCSRKDKPVENAGLVFLP